MVAIKLPIFAGMVPSIDKHLLNDQNAAYALNTWLYSGALVGMPKFNFLHQNVGSSSAAVFRIPTNFEEPGYLPGSTWVEFENPNTDFIKAPISGDTFNRYYWASSSGQPMYNTLARIIAGTNALKLGLPSPSTPTVTVGGGSSTLLVSRAYVVTFVTAYGEEGPASVPVLVNGKFDDTFTVTVGGVPANDMNGVDRMIANIRVWRTVVSSSGATNYYLVQQIAATTTNQAIVDIQTDALISSRITLDSTAWTAPPVDLEGFTVMPNGIIASWRGNELWFSEAYRPHAWPAAYSLSLEHTITGLGIVGQTLVVCTEGNPYTASGVNPASITTSKLGAFEPCTSRGSIVSTEEGVYYTSRNGLMLVNSGVAENVTRKVISRDEWQKLTGSAPVRAGKLSSAYYAFGAGLPLSFQEDAFQTDMVQASSEAGARAGFMIDPTSETAGVTYIDATDVVTNVTNDYYSGEVIIIFGNAVYWLDQSPGYATKPYVWKSKVFQVPEVKNFTAFKVYFDTPEDLKNRGLPARNNTINQVFNPATQLGVVRIYADSKHILTHELQISGELNRLPSGFKADFWQIEFEAQVRIKSFQMATSIKELASV